MAKYLDVSLLITKEGRGGEEKEKNGIVKVLRALSQSEIHEIVFVINFHAGVISPYIFNIAPFL